MQPTPLLPVVAVLTSLSPLAAQSESRGIFPGVPAALSLEASNAPGALPGDGLHLKRHGFQQSPPASWPAGTGPIMDLRAILQNCGARLLDVDALSMGEDWILADDSTGRISVPQDRWAAITFSVTRGSAGAPNSRIRTESTGNGAGADVFSWVLPGSALPGPLVDRTERAHDSTEIDLSGQANAELDALDHFLPMFTLEPGVRAMMPQNPSIFFSVSNASLGQVPSSWWGGTPASGATILQVTFQPTGGWSCPRPFMTFRDLSLTQSEDLDALAVDLLNQRILFSTKTPSRNPILFLYYGTDTGTPVDYEDQTGTPVSTKIGLLQNDDVDAICSMDPSIRARGNRPNAFFFFAGTPRPSFLGPSATLGGSAFRNYVNGNARIDAFMVGWPPNSGPGPGFAALLMTWEDTTCPVLSLAPLFPRNPGAVFLGDPQQYGLVLPANWSLINVRITLRWFAVNGNFSELAEAWPVRVVL